MDRYIIQITPEATPLIGGVASYTEHIQRSFTKQHIENYTVSFNGMDTATDTFFSGANVGVFKKYIQDLIKLNTHKKCTILLHYVSYGYHENGLPFYLVNFFKNISPEIQIITIFHEIGANGPIWTKAFWTARLQKGIARRLALRSDAIITTTPWYKDILQKWVGDGKVIIQAPVFSNMGEPELRIPMQHRSKTMVIFGGKALKEKLYETYLKQILHLKELYQISHIVDIGSPVDAAVYTANDIESVGICSDAVVSSYLNNAWLGIMHYDLRTLDKSGVHAAYQAHGLPTVVCANAYSDLLPSYNILGGDPNRYSESELEQFSIDQFQHYHRNRSIASLVQNIINL